MKILTDKQIRAADRATVEREPVSSLDLMERAAEGIAQWIAENIGTEHRLLFCCGKGGNGGDGLAVARILWQAGRECAVFLAVDTHIAEAPAAEMPAAESLAADTRENLARLPSEIPVSGTAFEPTDIEPDTVIVDALLGVGVTGEVREPVRSIIDRINSLPNRVISIDIPSGMATEWGSANAPCDPGASPNPEPAIVRADTTLTIEFPKLALLQPDTGRYAGDIVIVPIGLDTQFMVAASTPYYYITQEWVDSLQQPRAKFSHKGTYGHALLVCGSNDMPGAAILATGGALRSGCGLVTAHIPQAERFALTANHPSAMLSLDRAECFSTLPARLERFSAIGVGCGLGRDPKTVAALEKLLAEASATPFVLDADALNIIAENRGFRRLIPAGSVLTPHPGELRRLTGDLHTDKEKLEKASELAHATRSVVIVKGAHSVICTPDGRFLFNSTGTPGMAKGGSGDVLTGLITGLMARGYDAEAASVTGVYTHGMAGERAAEMYGVEAMNAGDLAEFLRPEKN